MDIIHLILLGLVQGITEFLPISSSAHLILLPKIMGWQDQGIAYDIAAHLGSLTAVVCYFYKDILSILSPWCGIQYGSETFSDKRVLLFLVIATLPIAIVGLLFYGVISEHLRNPLVIAWASILFGLLLWWADRQGNRMKSFQDLSYKSVIIIGIAQAIALIPGTSRSGITMTAGLMMGFDRATAARFSFLLAIPTILLAGGYEGLRYFMGDANTDWSSFLIVASVSALSAYVAIHFFIQFIEKTGMLPYVIYRIILGGMIILLI